MKKKWYVDTITKLQSDCFVISAYGTYAREQEFDNYDDALTAAKKQAARSKEDVTIYTIDSVVTFPEPDLKVVKVD